MRETTMVLRALLLGSLSFGIALVAGLAFHSGLSITSNEQLTAISTGFYTFEKGRETPFVWTSAHAELNFGTLDRRPEWRLQGKVRAYRPQGQPLASLRIAVDGRTMFEQNRVRGEIPLDIVLPPRAGARGAIVTIDTMPSFGSRGLGVTLRSMSLTPQGTVPPPMPALAAGVLAIVFLGSAMAAIGLRNWWLDVILIAVGWSLAWLMTQRLALYFGYPALTAQVAVAVAAGAMLVVYAIKKIRGEALSSAACAVIAMSLTACYLKLLVLLHPNMPIGDGVFQAHRFEYVLGGRLFFTSIAPGNYAFPYPVLLYIVAAPFSFLTSDTLDRMALLRIVTTASDAIAGALLYWMIVRATRDRLVGVAAVIWYHAIPMTAWIMTWGNLTNAFGQSLFVATLGLIVALPVDSTRRWTVVIVAAVAAAAMLSHPSTFAILTLILAAIACLYYWPGGEPLRSNAKGLAVAAAIAVLTAVVLYYAWFPNVYISELGRIASERGARITGRTTSFGTRVALEPVLAGQYLGWVAIVSAIIGMWALWKSHAPRQLTLALIGWAGACLLFVMVGVLSRVEFRYYFAFFPVLALAAAHASRWAWHQRMPFRAALVAVMTAAIWVGIRQWVWVLSW